MRRIDELTRELFNIFADIRGFGSEVQRGRTAPRPGPAWAIDPDRLAYAVRTFSAVWIILFACIYIPDFPMPPGIIPVAAAISIQLALMPALPFSHYSAVRSGGPVTRTFVPRSSRTCCSSPSSLARNRANFSGLYCIGNSPRLQIGSPGLMEGRLVMPITTPLNGAYRVS